MGNRLSDNRAGLAMTVAEADQVFQEIAELEIKRAVITTRAEARIAVVKAKAAEEVAVIDGRIRPLEKRLSEFIVNHPTEFRQPRQRKTEWGKYGLRSVRNIEITDEVAVMAACEELGIDAIVVTRKINKKVLEKALKDGVTIPGVELRTGEIGRYDVARTLIDRAVGQEE